MKNIFIFTFFVLNLSTVYGYVPTVDSLLRNGNNAEIGQNTVVAKLNILEEKQASSESEEVINTNLKMIIYNENEKRPRLMQIQYAGNSYSNSMVKDYKIAPFHDLEKLFPSEGNLEKEVFYALMASLVNNNSSLLLDVFKRLNIPVSSNKELVNEDKGKLLAAYRDYLKKLSEQEDGNTEEELINPLRSEDEEERKRIKEIMAGSYFKQDFLVSRKKEQNEFFWIVENEKLFMKFDSDHRMKMIKLITDLGVIEIICSRFVVVGSQLEFPEFIWFKDLSGKKFKISAKSIRLIKDSKENYYKRVQKYKKLKEANNITNNELKPEFVM